MTATENVLIIFGVMVVGLSVAVALYATERANRAVASAKASAEAAQTARRHCDGLIELLAELSPSARRAWQASRDRRSLAVVLATRHLARQHGHRFEDTP